MARKRRRSSASGGGGRLASLEQGGNSAAREPPLVGKQKKQKTEPSPKHSVLSQQQQQQRKPQRKKKVASDGSDSESVYCLCRKGENGKFMIACDSCNEWFHGPCVNITKREANKLKQFYCPRCAAEPTTKERLLRAEGEKEKQRDPNKRTAEKPHKIQVLKKEKEEEKVEKEKKEEEEEEEEEEEAKEDEEEEQEESQETEYERKRKERLEQNKAFLQALGLGVTKQELMLSFSSSNGNSHPQRSSLASRNRKKKRRSVDTDSDGDNKNMTQEPQRKSRRLMGESAPDLIQIAQTVKAEKMKERENLENVFYTNTARVYFGQRKISLDQLCNITVPITLPSLGITIWSLGQLYKGPNEELYWSSSQCRYRHPYPVGYLATKEHWGKVWVMTIKEGDAGPLFCVAEKRSYDPRFDAETTEEKKHNNADDSNDNEKEAKHNDIANANETEKAKEQETREVQSYVGTSPTHPWTQVCIHGPSPGSRISGPLFFGFSDPITQHLLKEMLEKENATAPHDENATASSSCCSSSCSSSSSTSSSSSSSASAPPPSSSPSAC
ncbi:FYR C-terminal domain-containing protein [Balamuthia mandrillaris]